ncbi:MAG: DUF1266 domain-containing protein [Methylacidiphilales bacterium]|nr:DUF1266 domain-containing protein [Candidatus Methylacidiphilales bacterium]
MNDRDVMRLASWIASILACICLSGLPLRAAQTGVNEEKSNSLNENLVEYCRKGDLPAVEMSLSQGASLTYRNSYTETALMNAADTGQTDVVRFLLAKGADPAVSNKDNRTALTFALIGRHQASALLLLDAMQDSNSLKASDKFGDNYLTWAAGYDGREAVRRLMERKVPVDLPGRDGETALSYAAENDLPEMMEILLSYKANPNLPDKEGKTPYAHAAEWAHVELMNRLVKAGAIAKKTCLKLPNISSNTKLVTNRHWCLSAAALLTFSNYESCEWLGGYPPGKNVESNRRRLDYWWGVKDRKAAIKELKWLEKDGHRVNYRKYLEEIQNSKPESQPPEGLARAWIIIQEYLLSRGKRSLHGRFTAEEIATIRQESTRHKAKNLLAWDYCRIINLAGWCHHAGYISEEEAWQHIFPAARKLQSTYCSWKEMSDDYILGRVIWQKEPQDRMSYLQERLLDPSEPASPWAKLPWQTPLQ